MISLRKSFSTVLLVAAWMAVWAQAPTNYYQTTTDKKGTDLQLALHELIDNHTSISYDALWNAFKTTDKKSDGSVWDMYSDKPGQTPAYEYTFTTNQCGNYSGEGDCYNREHSFPKSWFNDQPPMYSDLFHLYPTDGYVNNKRGNYPLGEVGTATWTSTNGSKLGNNNTSGYSGVVFEPIDEYKGDFARTYFYMATRYYTEDSNWSGSDMCTKSQLKPWALELMLKWHQNDPVSSKEVERNNAVYAYQNNRNPFIDNPNFALLIWDSEADAVEPDNHVVQLRTATAVTLTWDNPSGAVLPDGYLIIYSTNGFDAIPTPADGLAPETYSSAVQVGAQATSCTLSALQPETDYFFKIFTYTGSGNLTNYKTDGIVPQTTIRTE
jgi:endonuclease I